MDVRISCRILNGDLFFFPVDVVVEAAETGFQPPLPVRTPIAWLCLFVCYYVIRRHKAESDARIYIYFFFLSVGKRMCFQIPLSPVDPTNRGEPRLRAIVPGTLTEAPMTLSVGSICYSTPGIIWVSFK